MIGRSYQDRVKLARARSIDWELLHWLDSFIRSRIPAPTSEAYSIDFADGEMWAHSFEEMREAGEAAGKKVTRVWVSVEDHSTMTISCSFGAASRRALGRIVIFEGPDHDRVLGAAAALRRGLPKHHRRWGKVGARARKLVAEPNPWVVTIVGTVLAALIVGFTTDWFGLTT